MVLEISTLAWVLYLIAGSHNIIPYKKGIDYLVDPFFYITTSDYALDKMSKASFCRF